MKALSIRQPWAWLICAGIKPVENRVWGTAWRGELLIHAGQAFDAEGLQGILARWPYLHSTLPAIYSMGGIVGAARLVDCVQEHRSDWFNGPHGLVMADARHLPFVRWPGKLSLFDIPDNVVDLQALHAATSPQAEAAGQNRLF